LDWLPHKAGGAPQNESGEHGPKKPARRCCCFRPSGCWRFWGQGSCPKGGLFFFFSGLLDFPGATPGQTVNLFSAPFAPAGGAGRTGERGAWILGGGGRGARRQWVGGRLGFLCWAGPLGPPNKKLGSPSGPVGSVWVRKGGAGANPGALRKKIFLCATKGGQGSGGRFLNGGGAGCKFSNRLPADWFSSCGLCLLGPLFYAVGTGPTASEAARISARAQGAGFRTKKRLAGRGGGAGQSLLARPFFFLGRFRGFILVKVFCTQGRKTGLDSRLQFFLPVVFPGGLSCLAPEGGGGGGAWPPRRGPAGPWFARGGRALLGFGGAPALRGACARGFVGPFGGFCWEIKQKGGVEKSRGTQGGG